MIPEQQSRAEPPAGRICTAMATPFAADGSLDLDASRTLARYLVEHGSEALVLAGTTGEGPTLTDSEKLALFDAVLDEVGSDARIIANTGTYDTAHSVHLTREARQAGVHGFLAVTPYYNKPPAEGLARHFAAIATAADGLPVIIYNIPQRVILNLEPDLLVRLARESENVVAVKQATTDLDQARAILAAGLVLYAGNDDLLAPFLELGGVGGICVASHLVGSEMLRMCDLAESGDHSECERVVDSDDRQPDVRQRTDNEPCDQLSSNVAADRRADCAEGVICFVSKCLGKK